MKRRIAALLLAAAVLLNMTACAGKSGDTFRYDFGAQVTNLDPQFAIQEEAKTVLANCMEGLLRQSGGGCFHILVGTGKLENLTSSRNGLNSNVPAKSISFFNISQKRNVTFKKRFVYRKPVVVPRNTVDGNINVHLTSGNTGCGILLNLVLKSVLAHILFA